MQRILSSIITFFCIIVFWGCNSVPQQSWIKLIPLESTFVIVPKSTISLTDIPNTEYASILDDLTPNSLQQVLAVDSSVTNLLNLKALVLYPSSSTESQFIWISDTNEDIKFWAERFYEPFTQNNYLFNSVTIHKLHINQLTVFAAQVNNWLVMSQSSVAIESALRSYLGEGESIEMTNEPTPGQLIVNTEHIDNWVQQFVNVGYRPSIMGSFQGTKPASLTFTPSDSETPTFDFTGTIELKDTTHSILIDALTSSNRPILLDRFIASNAATFAIFRLAPSFTPPPISNPILTSLDSLLLDNNSVYRDLALATGDEFAFVAFPESGLLATGEFLFLRKLENAASFRSKMDEFDELGLVSKQGNSYAINSPVLAQLIGSEIAPFTDFYLSFSRDVVAISKRKGLSESVDADRNRRRTMYYDDTYSTAKEAMSTEVSGVVWSYTDNFEKFVQPFLLPKNFLNGLLSKYDITSMEFSKVNNSSSVNFSFKSLTEEGSIQPYDELWVLPINNEELTGKPILGDIVGSSTDEIIFSTESGSVMALAFDGTVVMQASTNGDKPIGSPILYDWYGNGQPIILLAAGTKIYAWNEGGNSLPQFPIEIGERISAPIVVTDVLRNGIPEIIVATENRKIHVIDGRGQNVRGWPQFTNAIVTNTPTFEQVDDTWSIWVYSQNILHSWLRSGGVRPGYPTFINSTFTSSPYIFENQVLGAAADGYIYSIGKSPSFKDSLAISIQQDSVSIKSLYTNNSPLTSISVAKNVLLKDSTLFYRSDLYITQSLNGSLFMFNPDGELELTHSLGQPASLTMSPQIINLNSDNLMEIISLAEFGRLFAWEVLTDKRLFNIPTSGMKYPIIADLNGDGLKELIANTREGLRCWTINKPEE